MQGASGNDDQVNSSRDQASQDIQLQIEIK
jgi:hypothetical protein